ncbi:MAG: DUF5367 family protein [Janthinobacterium lividum]
MTILSAIALLFWVVAAAWIHFFPAAIVDPLQGSIGFLTSIPVCWLCILLARRAAMLSREQLVSGTAVVVAVAMLIDASVLHWAPGVYSDNEAVRRLGAAWLLWGYGISLGIALLMQHRRVPATRLASPLA